ncbi:hypothetical protein BDV09DRAFT_196024 [Aspergillus tetrazonus]
MPSCSSCHYYTLFLSHPQYTYSATPSPGTLSGSVSISASQYGYQIIAGFGCGINITLLVAMTPLTVENRDNAVAMGAVAQIRVMGGCIGIAIATAVADGYLQSHLQQVLRLEELPAVLQSAAELSALSVGALDSRPGVGAPGFFS